VLPVRLLVLPLQLDRVRPMVLLVRLLLAHLLVLPVQLVRVRPLVRLDLLVQPRLLVLPVQLVLVRLLVLAARYSLAHSLHHRD
jgi:hypothetical protein